MTDKFSLLMAFFFIHVFLNLKRVVCQLRMSGKYLIMRERRGKDGKAS